MVAGHFPNELPQHILDIEAGLSNVVLTGSGPRIRADALLH